MVLGNFNLISDWEIAVPPKIRPSLHPGVTPLYVVRLGYEFAAMLVTLVYISYFALQKFALTLRGTNSWFHEEKKN